MKRYQKPLIVLTLLALGVQSYADVLQTSVGANHSTPKVVTQTPTEVTSTSVEINPYGKLSDVNQDPAEVIGIDFNQNPFIYGSGYHDTESDLEYMGARYYSADIGRFMAQDSYDLINRYNYANANPIMYIDPDGHFAEVLNYALNGAGAFIGAVTFIMMIASGGSIIPILSAGAGVLSAGAGIGSQLMADTSPENAKLWNNISFYSGIASTFFDVAAVSTHFYYKSRPIKTVFNPSKYKLPTNKELIKNVDKEWKRLTPKAKIDGIVDNETRIPEMPDYSLNLENIVNDRNFMYTKFSKFNYKGLSGDGAYMKYTVGDENKTYFISNREPSNGELRSGLLQEFMKKNPDYTFNNFINTKKAPAEMLSYAKNSIVNVLKHYSGVEENIIKAARDYYGMI